MSDDDAPNADAPNAQTLEAKIAALIEPSLNYMGFDLVRVSVLGRVRQTVQVMADRADGSLIAIEDCQLISEQVGAILDVHDAMPKAWTLEVSSAGIDRPLTRARDWARFAGHRAKAETYIAQNGRRRFAGVVLGTEANEARMRLDDGTEVALPLPDIRRAQLVLTDALIAATAPARTETKETDA